MSANPKMISESMIMGEANEKVSNPYPAIIFEKVAAFKDFDIPEKININPAIKLYISTLLFDIEISRMRDADKIVRPFRLIIIEG